MNLLKKAIVTFGKNDEVYLNLELDDAWIVFEGKRVPKPKKAVKEH